MKKFLLSLSVFAGFGALAQAPVNDVCADAVALTVGATCVEVEGTLLGATNDGLSQNGQYNAVFYKFVATDERALISAYHGDLDLVIDVYGGACGALTPITSIDSYSALESDIVGGLTIGETYYIAVRDFEGNNTNANAFTVCVQEVVAPANDDCAGAITLNVATAAPTTETDFVMGDLFTSTVSDVTPESTCEFIEDGHLGDLWYKFTPAVGSVVVMVIQEGYLDAQIDVYEGSCDAFEYLGCVDGEASDPASQTASDPEGAVITVIPGETYYLRVKDYFRHYFGSQFGITVFTDPALAIAKVDVNGLHLYPNPATDIFTVKANTEIVSVVVTNAVGQVVTTMNQVSGNQVKVNTDELANGLYNVTVVTAQGQSSKLINVVK